MSRYLLLILLNAPFALAGFVSTLTSYKMGKMTHRRFAVYVLLWLFILAGLVGARPLYSWLVEAGLTDSNSLSLFDVVQITAIILLLSINNKTRMKLDIIEQRSRDLHRELSIRSSQLE